MGGKNPVIHHTNCFTVLTILFSSFGNGFLMGECKSGMGGRKSCVLRNDRMAACSLLPGWSAVTFTDPYLAKLCVCLAKLRVCSGQIIKSSLKGPGEDVLILIPSTACLAFIAKQLGSVHVLRV